MKYLLFPALALSIMTIISCKKETTGLSRLELLTSGQWKITSFKLSRPIDFNGDGTLDSDAYATYEPCQKDNYFVFRANGEMDIYAGPLKCDPSDNDKETGTWKFADGEKQIIISGDVAEIIELSPSLLWLNVDLGNTIGNVRFTR